jgi:hypothetical protein
MVFQAILFYKVILFTLEICICTKVLVFVCDIDEMVITSFVVGYPCNFHAYSNYQAFVLTQ